MTAKINNTKEYVDIDETIFKHCIFLITSCNYTNLDEAVNVAFKKLATADFIRDMAWLFGLTVQQYKEDMKRRVTNAIKS